jgi:D-methionine transport system substrate-binding protein
LKEITKTGENEMRLLSIFILCLNLIACGNNESKNSIKVGTIAGPETSLVETAKELAKKKYHLDIKIVEFNDYNLPNEALNDGSLDANIFQHQPYLEATMKARNYPFAVIGKTFLYPMAIYSAKHKNLAKLPERAIIAIPNDPSNSARALLLLKSAGLIDLKTMKASTLADITNNTKNLRIKELDAALLPRALGDVDAAIINTNFAIPAGLSLHRDALFIEPKDSPYANLIVIRKDSKKKALLQELVSVMNSEEVKNKAQSIFGDVAIPTW